MYVLTKSVNIQKNSKNAFISLFVLFIPTWNFCPETAPGIEMPSKFYVKYVIFY